MILIDELIYTILLFICFTIILYKIVMLFIDCYKTDLIIEKNYSIKKTTSDIKNRLNKANRKCKKCQKK